jgi:L-threonine-O-3-phosphate decarboxylase
MLEHGGRLLRAARIYGIAPADWLDLSTGISPFAWPVPPIPAAAWARLPDDEDGLVEAAQAYYGAPQLLPVAGSQAAIQMLPLLRPTSRVGVIAPGYNEHAQAWQRAGHQVIELAAEELLARADDVDVMVLIHPNNPGGDRFDPATLLACHAHLAVRAGWLIVDEAFMDATPDDSLCSHTTNDGLIVLRSVGKFFGMAGARAGFICANTTLLDAARERLGPWTVSGPARYALRHALADFAWHAQARARLQACSARLAQLLTKHDIAPTAGCAFFQWWRSDGAGDMHRALAAQGILTRLFDQPHSLRFGLPEDDADFERLDAALARCPR